MQGLELARAFYEEYGRPMLEEQFPSLMPFLAVGLFGSGSECFGYDDMVSRDHDFEPGFCLFLPGEDVVDRRSAFLLERAYGKLPREYLGFRRPFVAPVGGARRGVLRTAEFFQEKVGAPDGVLSGSQWLSVPEQGLAEATNGCLFFDRYGEVTEIRRRLMYFPEDIRRKRLAGNLLLMAQAGGYNYGRCLAHGEPAAAQLALYEYVESAISAIFLINRQYKPFYKWCFRALRALPRLGELEGKLAFLLCSDNGEDVARQKQEAVLEIDRKLAAILLEENLSKETSEDLEAHAYRVNDRIADPEIRNMHILAGV